MFTNQAIKNYMMESHNDTRRCIITPHRLLDGLLGIDTVFSSSFATGGCGEGDVFFAEAEATFCVAFCNNLTSFKSASDMIAYSTGFISSSSSKTAASSDSERSARTAS